MDIVVIGAGGIGGWLGTRLADAGHRVGFLVHGATLEALGRRGLTLTGPGGSVRARIETPVAAADPAELLRALGRRPQTVLLATKVGAIHGLAPALRALAGPRTAVVTTQNGVEAPRLVARAVGRERVLPGVSRVYARVVERGRVETMSDLGAMQVGEWDGGTSPRVRELVAALRSAGVSARASENIWAELWRKAAFVVPQGGSGRSREPRSASCGLRCATAIGPWSVRPSRWPRPWGTRWPRTRPRTWSGFSRSPTSSPSTPRPRCSGTSPPVCPASSTPR